MKALTKMSPKSMSFFPKLLDVVAPKTATLDDVDTLFIVMDHVETDLGKIVKSGAQCQLDKTHVRNIIYNLLCALNFLTTANVIHRDIKPGNILMNKFCQIRICDFGLARTLAKSAQVSIGLSPQTVRKTLIEKQIHIAAPSSTRGRIIKKL